jgi:hypothetical protein
LSSLSISARHPVRTAALLLLLALAGCLLAYLTVTIPSSWFPRAETKTWLGREMGLSRGGGHVEKDEMVVTATAAADSAVVSVITDFNSYEYPVIAWSGIDFADNADVRVLWYSDYASAKVNIAQLSIASGRLLPVSLVNNPAYVGRIKGLALLIKGPLAQPVRIRGVTIKASGAAELLRDRVREWMSFEGWTGTSINTVAGGADVQDLPLPTLLAVSVAIVGLIGFLLARRPAFAPALPAVMAAAFVLAWTTLDVRWLFNLQRQVAKTVEQYGGKDWHEKRLAAEDGELFAFIERAVAKMPDKRARVFMFADAHYFRGRGAYHLYPHNVYYDPFQNTLPPSNFMHKDDYIVVYYRRGVLYDASKQLIRWEGNLPIGAEPVLVEPGAALFRVK